MIKASVRRRVADGFQIITKDYHFEIPLDCLFEVLRREGINPVQEDGSPWSGFLCGEDGRAYFDLQGQDGRSLDYVLVVTWHRMESGRWETVAYLS